jgi:hypothetical protein
LLTFSNVIMILARSARRRPIDDWRPQGLRSGYGRNVLPSNCGGRAS